MVNYRKLKQAKVKLALEEIKQLFANAEKNFSKADRCIAVARKTAMKHNIKLPRELKRKYCKHCYSYLTSKNSRTRTRDGKLVIFCMKCKKFTRIPLSGKRQVS